MEEGQAADKVPSLTASWTDVNFGDMGGNDSTDRVKYVFGLYHLLLSEENLFMTIYELLVRVFNAYMARAGHLGKVIRRLKDEHGKLNLMVVHVLVPRALR